MKNFLLLCLFLLAGSVFGQTHLKEFSYEDTRNPEIYRGIKNGTTLNTYLTADGTVLKLRDTLVLGSPVGSEFREIIRGRPSDLGNIFRSRKGKNRPGREMTGEGAVILAMKVEHEGNKNTPLSLVILLGETGEGKTWEQKFLTVTNYERSVRAGEISGSRQSVAEVR